MEVPLTRNYKLIQGSVISGPRKEVGKKRRQLTQVVYGVEGPKCDFKEDYNSKFKRYREPMKQAKAGSVPRKQKRMH